MNKTNNSLQLLVQGYSVLHVFGLAIKSLLYTFVHQMIGWLQMQPTLLGPQIPELDFFKEGWTQTIKVKSS